jgi:hypothetical protein
MTVIPFPRPSDNTTTAQARWNETQPRHLRIALINVETGVKPSSAGIRRCRDCRRAYIDDQSDLPHCRDCRTNHHRPCC